MQAVPDPAVPSLGSPSPCPYPSPAQRLSLLNAWQRGFPLCDEPFAVVGAALELAARHPGEQILLVAHGGVLDVLYRAATRLELQAPRSWQLANCAINRLLWSPEGLNLIGWGDVRHLQADEGEEEDLDDDEDDDRDVLDERSA